MACVCVCKTQMNIVSVDDFQHYLFGLWLPQVKSFEADCFLARPQKDLDSNGMWMCV